MGAPIPPPPLSDHAWIESERKDLRISDYFERRWNSLLRAHVWAVRKRTNVAVAGSIGSLVALRTALARVYAFHAYAPNQYAYAASDGCGTTAASCAALLAEAGDGRLVLAMRCYWVAAHVIAAAAVVLDLSRALGMPTALGDALLGFRTAHRERRRKFAFALLLVPLAHLGGLLYRPVVYAGGCCVATPLFAAFRERATESAVICVACWFGLLAKSQDHGYFLFRVPPLEEAALLLARDHVIRCEDVRSRRRGAVPHRLSVVLAAAGQGGGGPEKPHHADSDNESGSDSDAPPRPPPVAAVAVEAPVPATAPSLSPPLSRRTHARHVQRPPEE